MPGDVVVDKAGEELLDVGRAVHDVVRRRQDHGVARVEGRDRLKALAT
jgi:hypothetical protein